ncbi:MAG: O-methyltransferase [Acidimicrobiia bacterium]
MSPRSFLLNDALHEYLVAHAAPLDDVQRALIDETAALGAIAEMQIAPEQGAFMALMTTLIGAKEAIEIGTFTGYSALCVARALPPIPDGRLVCCDVSEEWTSIGQKYWQQAGVDDRIELCIGPAIDTLRSLGNYEQFDIAFIDADKAGYRAYYEELLPRMRRGALIMVDNTLWSGEIVNASNTDPDTLAMRAFNDKVATDDRVESVILPLADGVTMIRKR